MYSISLQREFKAVHYLIGGDWGPENDPHSHDYRVVLILRGPSLDQHGYLVDLIEVEDQLDRVVSDFEGRTLNDLPAFDGLNPSLEHFSRIIAVEFAEQLDLPNVQQVEVQLWETERAWAAYRCDLPCESG